MTITIDATYEGGVLVPAQPLPLKEHEKVRVRVEPQAEIEAGVGVEPIRSGTAGPSLAEKILAIARSVPDDVVDSWPTDGASQHDHYIYGTPKRPALPE